MLGRIVAISFSLLMATTLFSSAQAPPPPGDNKPLLRLEAGGPTSNVTALVFSPDGETLYAAGFDKVVRVWGLNAGKFELDAKRYFRVPINPGTEGAINAMAISSDGKWLAVGGLGVVRVAAGFFDSGRLWPTAGLKPELRYDQGLIYVFATDGQDVKMLRGHRGPIVSLAFAPQRKDQPPILVSAAQGWDFDKNQVVGEARVWDVAKGESIGDLGGLPRPFVEARAPGLAASRAGANPNQIRVAIAWGDKHQAANGSHGYMRIWDLPEGKLQKLVDGFYNTALTMLPDETSVLAGSFAMPAGQLKTWDLTANPPVVKQQAGLPAPAKAYYFPDGVEVFSVKDKQAADHAALLVRQLTPAGQVNALHLIDLRAGRFGQSRVQVPLWQNSTIGAVMAATPRGRHIAVAGNADHTIRVYAVDDLLQQKFHPQVLQSVGETIRHVAFVEMQKKGKSHLGLLLGKTKGKADLVFDFEQRLLTEQVQNYKATTPNVGAWSVQEFVKDNATILQLAEGNKIRSRVSLAADQQLETYALLPPIPARKTPLLAVSSYLVRTGTPLLDLYDVGAGKHFRRFTGHSAPIKSLAVSPDGRLLASASNDQTVAVWSLSNVSEILDKHGGLNSVTVVARDKDVVVQKMDDDSSAKGKLSIGTSVNGTVDGGELKPFKTPRDFYEAFWAVKPGAAVTLRIVDGKKTQDVAVNAEQGVDDRKPLFSLFITRPSADGKREWLGWNFVGPFDSSSTAAENFVGWHFNTGKTEEPTKFAALKQYRDEFFKKDILKFLMSEGSLPQALEKHKQPAPPRPDPKIDDPVGLHKAPNGDLLVRERKTVLQVPIQDFTLMPDDTIAWQLNDEKPQTFEPPAGNLWSMPLPELPAQGQRHTVRLKLWLKEAGKPAALSAQEWTVRYQPPPPTLKYQKDSAYDVATAADFVFQGTVHAPVAGAQVSLWLNDEAKPIYKWPVDSADKPQAISKKLKLKEGDNLIKLVAENQAALKKFEAEERHSLTVKVAFRPNAPTIAIGRIEAVMGEDKAQSFEPNQQVVVGVPRVRIKGTISAPAQLAAAEWDMGEMSERKLLAGFKPGVTTFPFDEQVALTPGPQTVRIFAKTAKSPEGMETVKLLYQPQLPRLVLLAPEPLIRETADKDKAEITVSGKLLPPAVPSPKFGLKATLVHNGKPLGEPIELDSTQDLLPERKITLTPGINKVQVALSYGQDWQGTQQVAEFQTRYVRPPRVAALETKLVGKEPFVDLVATVQSQTKLLPDSIQVLVNGKEQRYAQAEVKQAGKSWTVNVKEVPLALEANKEIHKNEIVLLVSNEEEQSAPSQVAAIVYKDPPPPRPEIVLVSPGTDSEKLDAPEVNLVFRVKSQKPLKRVEVTLNDKVVYRPEKFPEALETGVYEFNAGKLPLEWKVNQMRIEAVNGGGPSDTMLALSVPQHPVAVKIERLRTEGAKAKTFTPELSNGKDKFPKVPDGQVVLEGKVRWSPQDNAILKEARDVRVFVNGFQQVPAKLGPISPENPWERTFQARLILNLDVNSIEVDVPSLKLESKSRKECEVACAKRVTGQHLHVVLIAPGFKDDKDVNLSIAQALQTTRQLGPNRYQTKIFDEVQIHKLTGEVPYYSVDSLLHSIGGYLRERAARGSPNDVVIVYYLGQETINARGRFFWTSETRLGPNGPIKAFALNDLVTNHFAQFTGAQAMFLDLNSENVSRDGAFLDRDYRQALVRLIQKTTTNKPQLLPELEKDMHKATFLDNLLPILQARYQSDHFMAYHPTGLRMQINPAVSGTEK
ncbi:MAG: hypothetical protein L0Y72_30065 [Gemmataceae bacterium]|nr:hypothetical protein [Gemmataceae bacterium]MCI0743294.1 hypothetical protein [Gemmataceae bacterium]